MKSSILHKYKIAVAFIAYTATLEVGINPKNPKKNPKKNQNKIR